MFGKIVVAGAPMIFAVTLHAQSVPSPDFVPGEQGSRNVHIVAHIPSGGELTVGDIDIEQELSRPYVYMGHALRVPHGFDIISLKEPGRAQTIYRWRIENPELHVGLGGLRPRYFKTKGLFKKELVDETPFEEPCRKELEKWGRFTLVRDIKSADIVIRAYEKGQSNYVPVMSPGVTGSVNVGQSFFILDVWQPSSKKVIWSASKNTGTSWSTNTGIANLVKKLRESPREAIERLPTKQRQVVLMHYLEETSVKNVAELLSVSAKTVEGRLYQARRTLLRLLGDPSASKTGKMLPCL
jgi:RNA polymerase sigma factor (sigma-70 family)